MFVERIKNGWVVHAPAKINLALEVLGRQPDGYHKVETLLVPVRLFDRLVYSPSAEPLNLVVRGSRTCPASLLEADANTNLAVQAVQKLAELSGHPPTGYLELTKRIPLQAGLGGGSSDAAAALVAANAAWKLGYDRQQLARVAEQLGTDVPFFLAPGAAIGTGRGEQLERISLGRSLPIVLVQPPAGLSTPVVFAGLNLARGEQMPHPQGWCRELAHRLSRGCGLAACKHLVQNSLQQAARNATEWIDRMADAMERLPVLVHQMTGSGSAYFAVCHSWRDARVTASRLRGGHWQCVLATRTSM
ncbi:4-(cytidine 5'-diphospho)-2-C-methyl-D-erythritol kinase [Aeoliella sp. ICT_H6.2]|uniref:4-diphosphocytidyl-2-C-methyl-D-erythritol kinase n=1 Tax=Aeoliella straminimaris TaxID=2954799 RepID=A0A9X2FAD0_9BACT|nr:4-(cytidine 5'-diphospho)-2-C-methyl-D-erythritol kinase [Aeoliella straminimaris]MCO6042634.1 4-(cytidine 5'-diphospho)-2-C-methyl-D-erythritol kinase [Aeoliella straminimaris]